MIVNFRGSWLPLAEVHSVDAVLADMRWIEGAEALFAAARKHGIATVLDGDVADVEAFERILRLTDFAIFLESGLAIFGRGGTRNEALAAAAAMGCRAVAVTCGQAGSLWLDAGGLRQFPSFPVTVVDTTGAGDVFHGAFTYAIGAGAGLEEAVTFSSAAAALKCSHPGGRAGIADLAATLTFMNAAAPDQREPRKIPAPR